MDRLTLEEVRQKKDDYVRSQNFTFAVYMRDLEKKMMGMEETEEMQEIEEYASGEIDMEPFKKLYQLIKEKWEVRGDNCQFILYPPIPPKL